MLILLKSHKYASPLCCYNFVMLCFGTRMLTPSSPVDVHRSFGETSCLHLQVTQYAPPKRQLNRFRCVTFHRGKYS
jgi:hypothetical protein